MKKEKAKVGSEIVHVDDYDEVWTFYVDTEPCLMLDPVFRYGLAFSAKAHDYYGHEYIIGWALDHPFDDENQEEAELVDDWSACDYFEVL